MPEHIAEWVILGKADVGVATEGLSQFEKLVSFPCYRWHHVVVVPTGHSLAQLEHLTLQELAAYPLMTYDSGFMGRGHIDQVFRKAGLNTDIVLSPMDSDVIRQYVSLGLGVDIVAEMAMKHNGNQELQAIEVAHLFTPKVTRIAVRRGPYLRSYICDFILRLSPELTRADIEQALSPRGEI